MGDVIRQLALSTVVVEDFDLAVAHLRLAYRTDFLSW